MDARTKMVHDKLDKTVEKILQMGNEEDIAEALAKCIAVRDEFIEDLARAERRVKLLAQRAAE